MKVCEVCQALISVLVLGKMRRGLYMRKPSGGIHASCIATWFNLASSLGAERSGLHTPSVAVNDELIVAFTVFYFSPRYGQRVFGSGGCNQRGLGCGTGVNCFPLVARDAFPYTPRHSGGSGTSFALAVVRSYLQGPNKLRVVVSPRFRGD